MKKTDRKRSELQEEDGTYPPMCANSIFVPGYTHTSCCPSVPVVRVCVCVSVCVCVFVCVRVGVCVSVSVRALLVWSYSTVHIVWLFSYGVSEHLVRI